MGEVHTNPPHNKVLSLALSASEQLTLWGEEGFDTEDDTREVKWGITSVNAE